MDSLNERNDLLANADSRREVDQRAEQFIALGADRGVARQIAAIELGLIGSDRVDLGSFSANMAHATRDGNSMGITTEDAGADSVDDASTSSPAWPRGRGSVP